MKLEKVPLEATGLFAPVFLDYLAGKSALKAFYNRKPQLASFEGQLAEKQLPTSTRQVLQKVLRQQYQGHAISGLVSSNLHLLSEPTTFTVTTGHQLNICTGPLYFIYKIITAINTCKALKAAYPAHDFVPVYWMATEDHDFEEINHFSLFGQKYTWETDQQGAVGRYNPSSLKAVLNQLPEAVPLFEEAYSTQPTLAQAVRHYVNALFGHEGLLVVDADDPQLKQVFAPVIKDDLLNHAANDLVEERSAKMASMGYKTQVYPRTINFFYLDNGLRGRIVRENREYKVLGTELVFTEAEILALVESHPERFSPNVILRPLYQEMILPNLAYIGGAAEVSYWLQLKGVFDHYKVPYPIVMPRNLALYLPRTVAKKRQKIAIDTADLFLGTTALKKRYVARNAQSELTIEEERNKLTCVFDQLIKKAVELDKSLEGWAGAEKNKLIKSLENIEKRLQKTEERKHETALKQLEAIKEKLFPNNGLQERTENFLNFYLNNNDFIHNLTVQFDPFDYRFHVLVDDE